MGCLTDRPSNSWNFVTARLANNVFITDVFEDIDVCSILLTPPVVMGQVLTSHSIQLDWTSNGGELSFQIYESIDNVSFNLIDTVGSEIFTYERDNLDSLTTYYYKLKGVSVEATTSEFSNTVDLTTTKIDTPSGLTLSLPSPSTVQLDWTSNSGGFEDGFKIERSFDDISYLEVGSVGTGVITYNDNSAPLGTLVYYRVKSFDSGGDSDPSNVESTTVISALVTSNDEQSGDFESNDTQ